MNAVDFLFEHSRESRADFIAGHSERLGIADLHDRVASLAAHLSRELGRELPVLLISDNSSFFVIAYLAVMKSGNVVIPVNPSSSRESLEHILGQTGCRSAFIQDRYLEKYAALVAEVYDGERVAALPTADEATDGPDLPDDHLAAILFTSGSTALPKGVMLSHGNIVANTRSIVDYLALTAADRMLVVLPFYYCYGLSLLHTHLRVGGSIVLNNSFIMLNTVIQDLQEHRCTGFAGVPSHFQIMLRKSRRFRESRFPDLRYVTQAGGKLPNVFIHEFRQTWPETRFYVMYGQTEATARLSYLPPEFLDSKLGSIGRGIPGVTLEVLDPAGNPVRPGEVGELAARGDNLMLGYFQDPELTAQTIRDGRLFTGDLGTVDEDGFVYVVARKKEFLKVGGERVSPREIEDVIVRLPEVVDCSVVGIPDETQGEAIKALVVLGTPGSLTDRDIVNHCAAHLGSAKIPKAVAFLDRIPVSATGKKVKATLSDLRSTHADSGVL